MDIKNLLSPNRITFDLKAATKEQAIDELINILYADGKLHDKEKFRKETFQREKEFSTGIGMGIAIPHIRDDNATEPTITIGISKKGIDFESFDNELTFIFFLIAVPPSHNDLHLELLSYLTRKVMYEGIIEKLADAKEFDQILEILS